MTRITDSGQFCANCTILEREIKALKAENAKLRRAPRRLAVDPLVGWRLIANGTIRKSWKSEPKEEPIDDADDLHGDVRDE